MHRRTILWALDGWSARARRGCRTRRSPPRSTRPSPVMTSSASGGSSCATPRGPIRLPCQVVYWRDGARPDERPADVGSRRTTTASASSRRGRCCSAWRMAAGHARSCRSTRRRCATIPALAPRGGALPAPAPAPTPAVPIVTSSTRRWRAICRAWRELSSPGARFEIGGAELGDLDQDGDADAAVLLTYLTDQRQPAQFLMAYRFDGDTYPGRQDLRRRRSSPAGSRAPSSASRTARSSCGWSCRIPRMACGVSGRATCCRTTCCCGNRPRAERPAQPTVARLWPRPRPAAAALPG